MATFELAEAHKDFLAKYYDEYGRTSQRAAVRKRASRDLIAQFGITKKEHTDQVEKVCTSTAEFFSFPCNTSVARHFLAL